jgi:hypothetical protein
LRAIDLLPDLLREECGLEQHRSMDSLQVEVNASDSMMPGAGVMRGQDLRDQTHVQDLAV